MTALDLPLLGQRYHFDRAGGVLVVEAWAQPGATGPDHFHPTQEERFEVVRGDVTFEIDGRPRPAHAGDTVVVAPGVRHAFANTGQEVAQLHCEVEPALSLQQFFEEAAILMNAGKVTATGIPKSPRAALQVAELTHRHRDTIVLTFPPGAVQRGVFPWLARLERRLRSTREDRQA